MVSNYHWANAGRRFSGGVALFPSAIAFGCAQLSRLATALFFLPDNGAFAGFWLVIVFGAPPVGFAGLIAGTGRPLPAGRPYSGGFPQEVAGKESSNLFQNRESHL